MVSRAISESEYSPISSPAKKSQRLFSFVSNGPMFGEKARQLVYTTSLIPIETVLNSQIVVIMILGLIFCFRIVPVSMF
jgi:hypothetical protein